MNSIATLDIEASGIHPDSYPIEIGIFLENGDSYCSLIKPADSWHYWSQEAEAIHGISREELEQHGRPLQEVTATLNQCLNHCTVYSDCWVLDHVWMIKLFEAAKTQAEFKLSDIMYRLSENEYEQLMSIKQTIEKELDIQRHRATNDARILQLAYKEIIAGR